MQIERVNISLDIGFTVYRFGNDYPCIALISGLSEYDGCGIAILRKIVEEIKNISTQGTLIIIPQFIEHKYIGRVDRSGLCLDDSTVICKLINKLKEIIPLQCLLIEIKCKKDFVPHIVIPSDDIDNRVNELVGAIPLEYVVKTKMKGFTQIVKKKGYTILTLIARGGKEFDIDNVTRGAEIVMNTLANLGFLKRKSNSVHQTQLEGYYAIRCISRGIFIPKIAEGVEVGIKTVIGSLDGVEMISPVSGVVLYVSRPRLCEIGDKVCVIAVKETS